MIEFQAVEQRRPQNNNWCNLKEHMVADLLGIRPTWIKTIPPPPKTEKKPDDVDGIMPQFKTIKTLKNWYIVQRQQHHVFIVEVLPNPQCYQFNFRVPPIDIHILNSQVYFLTSHTSIATASLTNTYQPVEQLIPHLGKIYGMYSGYRPQTVDVHSELNMIIKILHWNRGLEVYQLGSQSTNWFSNIIRMIGQPQPYEKVVIIQPDVLGCAMSGQSVQLIDLATKRPISQQIKINKLFNICALKIATFYRPTFLQSSQPGVINFILAFYIDNSTSITLYHVRIPLVVDLNTRDTVYLDQLVGNILLNNTAQTTFMCQIHLPDKSKIKDVKMCQNGLITIFATNTYEQSLDADFRPWTNIIQRKPIHLLNHTIQVSQLSDEDYAQPECMRNRITHRFPHNLLVRQLHNVYTYLATKSATQLIRVSQTLSASWKELYKFRQIVEFDKWLFVIRHNGIGILCQRSDQEQYHYLNYVRPYLKRQEDGIALSMSRLAITKKKTISHIVDSSIHNLHRLKVASNTIYDSVMKGIRDKLENLTNWVPTSGRTSWIVVNLIVSKVRSMLFVLRQLLPRLYPHSQRDVSHDDIKIISILCHISSIVQQNYEMYINNSSETCYNDILSLMIKDMLPIGIDNLYVHDDMAQTLFNKITYGLISFRDKIPFDRQNQLLNLINKMDVKYYANNIVECRELSTTLQVVQCCIAARKVDLLKERLFNMGSSEFKKNYEVLREYLKDKASREWNHSVMKARAILEAVMIKTEPCSIAAHSLAVMVPDPASKKMVKMLAFNDSTEIQQEIKEKLAYIKIEENPSKWLDHLTSTQPNTLSDIHQFYNQLKDPQTNALFFRQLFKLQCLLFNHLQEVQNTQKLTHLIKCMLMTLNKAIQQQSKADFTIESQTQRRILEAHQILLYDKKIPKRDLLEVLAIAQQYYPGRNIIPWEMVPRAIVSYLMDNKGHKEQIIAKTLKHFTDGDLASEISLKRMRMDRQDEAMTALNYSYMSYSDIAMQGQQEKELFRLMAEHKIRRDLERESGFP